MNIKNKIIRYLLNLLRKPSNKDFITNFFKEIIKSLFKDFIRKLVIGISISVGLVMIIIFFYLLYK